MDDNWVRAAILVRAMTATAALAHAVATALLAAVIILHPLRRRIRAIATSQLEIGLYAWVDQATAAAR